MPRRNSKSMLVLVVVALALSLAACGGSAATPTAAPKADSKAGGATMTLRLANVVQPDHPMNVAVQKFAKNMSDKSNGRIKINLFPARQLGDDRQLFEQVQQGSLDMAEISAAPMGSTTPLMTALQLPFLFTNWDQYLKVVQGEAGTKLLAGLDKNSVKALAVYNAGFRHFVTVSKPISKPADMQGLKYRVAEAPLHLDIFKALGSNPTPMPYGEIYTGLQNKVIDGLEMDLSAVLMEKHFEVAKNMTLSKHFTWPAVLMMNDAKFKALSPEDQKLFQDAARQAVEENVKDIAEIEKKVVAELNTKGMKLVELKPEEMQAFADATKDVSGKYTAQDPLIDAFYKAAKDTK